jgi:hypothetical protein
MSSVPALERKVEGESTNSHYGQPKASCTGGAGGIKKTKVTGRTRLMLEINEDWERSRSRSKIGAGLTFRVVRAVVLAGLIYRRPTLIQKDCTL